MVRVAITAGTLQPKPIIRGMKLLPWRPNKCMILSIMNAALAMYPLASSIEMKKKSIRMLGRKTSTPPTPVMMPSTSKSFSQPSFIAEPRWPGK